MKVLEGVMDKSGDMGGSSSANNSSDFVSHLLLLRRLTFVANFFRSANYIIYPNISQCACDRSLICNA
ncbi:hypothetical protein CJF32_00001127 [Rutstroemia sp. NJR-2017a WRK4]|nr:hypothetical protein CJF32_00001127 [Rutstroemia sp. NJR-2017a WRK4]